MTDLRQSAPTLEVLPLSDHEWRVSDPDRPSNDALCLIGFIERIGSVFETTVIGQPLKREYFATLHEAVDSLAR